MQINEKTLHKTESGIGLLFLGGLYIISTDNYLLFHTLAEFFAIIIAFGVFLFVWNSRSFIESDYYLLVGIAYLFVGSFDLLHALAYKGIGIFHNQDANLPTQLWIVARYCESITLLIAPLFILNNRRLSAIWVLVFYFGIFITLILGIFWLGLFPACYVEGLGLTNFKIISEYAISLILIGAAFHTYKYKAFLEPHMLRWLILSIIFSIAAEMSFTLYVDIYGFMNLLGHYFKIISYYLIYKAMIQTSLKRPYQSLFRKLQASEQLFRSYFELPLIGRAILSCSDKQWIKFNDKFCEMLGYSSSTLKKQTWESITHPDDWFIKKKQLEYLEKGLIKSYSGERRFIRKNGIIIEVDISVGCVRYEKEKPHHLVLVVTDITSRKNAERDKENLINELKEALSDIKTLQGLLPICPSCKKVRDDNGYWSRVEDYFCQRSELEFKYIFCENCLQNKYPDIYEVKQTAQQYRAYFNNLCYALLFLSIIVFLP